jgi:hypothetical protein
VSLLSVIRDSGTFIFDHATVFSAVVAAIAAVVVAIFTYVLAKVTGRQADLTRQGIELGNKEFIATHRPKILVRSFRGIDRYLPNNAIPNFIFIAHNVGESPATIIQVRSATLVLKDKEKIPNDLSFPFHEDLNVRLASGEKKLIPGNGASQLVGNEAMEIFASSKVLLCLGVVIYLDESKIQRETGFCRRYRCREDAWDTISESEYEYAY